MRQLPTVRPLAMLLALALALSVAPAAAFATTTEPGVIRGHVWAAEDQTLPYTPLAGIKVTAYEWFDNSVPPDGVWDGITQPIPDIPGASTVPTGVATFTDASGAYEFTGLKGDTPYTITYDDLTNTRRDLCFAQSGLFYIDAWGWFPDSFTEDANAFLPTLSGLKATRTTRTSGADRYKTAIAVSKANFVGADTVMLANGTKFADSLACSPLAGQFAAPILLTFTDSLPPGVEAEMARLAAGAGVGRVRIVIVGGPKSVSPALESSLRAKGYAVQRRGGSDRYALAAAIAEEVAATSNSPEPFLCRGDLFPDALSSAPFAYFEQRPILLTLPKTVPVATGNAWRRMSVKANDLLIVVGGRDSISGPVISHLGWDYTPDGELDWIDIQGRDRYTCAEDLVWFYKDWFWSYNGFDGFGLASGANFSDALTGGPAMGRNGRPIVLTPPTTFTGAAQRTFDRSKNYPVQLQVFGGPKSITDGVKNAANARLGSTFYNLTFGTLTLSGASVASGDVAEAARPGLVGAFEVGAPSRRGVPGVHVEPAARPKRQLRDAGRPLRSTGEAR